MISSARDASRISSRMEWLTSTIKSATAFAACGLDRGSGRVYVISTRLESGELDSVSLCRGFGVFCRELEAKGFSQGFEVCCDSAEPILIRSLKNYAAQSFPGAVILPARKSPVLGRIAKVNSLLAGGRLFLSDDCATLRDALMSAVWKEGATDTRLDNGSTDIDSLDAFEYCIERIRI